MPADLSLALALSGFTFDDGRLAWALCVAGLVALIACDLLGLLKDPRP